eukprot:1148663-Pelagomonas_calceolata.AAC.15
MLPASVGIASNGAPRSLCNTCLFLLLIPTWCSVHVSSAVDVHLAAAWAQGSESREAAQGQAEEMKKFR